MADEPKKMKSVRRPKKQKVKQGHKLVWLTLVIILIPALIIGYVLLVSARESDQPVEGSRFSQNDLNPAIQDSQIQTIQGELMSIAGVETATINLKSATLRVHLNMQDSASVEQLQNAVDQAYDIVNMYLPIETYFTNTADGKSYDLEIDAYNYLVDDTHPQEGWLFVKLTKTGAGPRTFDNLTAPKNAQLAEDVRYSATSTDAAAQASTDEEQPVEDETVTEDEQVNWDTGE